MQEQLNWEQKNDNVFIKFQIAEKEITFKLDDRILIHLIGNSPKIYFFKIFVAEFETEYLIDFSHLKPVIKSSGKLSVKFKTNQKVEPKKSFDFGKYTIARGESYQERFLGVEGWQPQEYFFNLIPLEQSNNISKPLVDNNFEIQTEKVDFKATDNSKQPEVLSNQEVKTVEPVKEQPEEVSKFKECPICGNIVFSDFEYCPHCFASFIKPEKDVDFAI